ncbi:hypothetical protein [Devosia psychrophila]|uniref:Response regulatory domain-containing protein n=1 Tax=Devosia psychrophila TaxID=728005 RepID=A0ABR5DW08_9HYPH|nr:hypothetical protein [Devosia psychrophila]KKC32207.1 hypothetical protein WH91_15725 [Devosia psychrophila]
MNEYVENAPYVALIDDDQHSAALLTRMLVAHGSPRIQWYGNTAVAHSTIATTLSDPKASWPSLIIIDLKAQSQASIEFLRSIQPLAYQKGVNAVVMVPPDGRQHREALEDAGASAIFIRHAEPDAYRREAASLVSFWARSQRLDAVGM